MSIIDSTLTPEDREELILHALQKTYFVSKPIAKAVLAANLANELRALDQAINATPNPYRWGKRAKSWFEGTRAVQELLYWREMRLRATAEKAHRSRYRTDNTAQDVPSPRPPQGWPTDQSAPKG